MWEKTPVHYNSINNIDNESCTLSSPDYILRYYCKHFTGINSQKPNRLVSNTTPIPQMIKLHQSYLSKSTQVSELYSTLGFRYNLLLKHFVMHSEWVMVLVILYLWVLQSLVDFWEWISSHCTQHCLVEKWASRRF